MATDPAPSDGVATDPDDMPTWEEGGEAPILVADLKGVPETLGYATRVFPTRAETTLDLDARHANRNGRVHGGIHATVLDAAMGFAASAAFARAENGRTADTDVLTLSMTTNFVGATDRDRIVATGRVDRHGRSLGFASGEVRDDEGTLLATATATFKRTRSVGGR